MSIKIISGDLLEAKEQYIAHQCNCVSSNAKTLADAIFKKYSYADTYKTRVEKSKPGTIDVLGNGSDERYVINMYSQYYPGFAKYANDSALKRIRWFTQCLNIIGTEIKPKSIAFPYLIGCCAAGGDWKLYYEQIERFAKDYGIKVRIYKLE